MANYIPTSKACWLLGLSLASSRRLTQYYKIRFIRDYNCKLWNMDDIQKELDKRKRMSTPPEGYWTTAEAAHAMRWSEPCALALLKRFGIRPVQQRIWNGKEYRKQGCWHKHEVRAILGEAYKLKRHVAPEGWLNFNDVKLYLRCDKGKAKYMLRKYNVPYKVVRKNFYLYNEDAVVAMRKDIYTKKSCKKNRLDKQYLEKS